MGGITRQPAPGTLVRQKRESSASSAAPRQLLYEDASSPVARVRQWTEPHRESIGPAPASGRFESLLRAWRDDTAMEQHAVYSVPPPCLPLQSVRPQDPSASNLQSPANAVAKRRPHLPSTHPVPKVNRARVCSSCRNNFDFV